MSVSDEQRKTRRISVVLDTSSTDSVSASLQKFVAQQNVFRDAATPLWRIQEEIRKATEPFSAITDRIRDSLAPFQSHLNQILEVQRVAQSKIAALVAPTESLLRIERVRTSWLTIGGRTSKNKQTRRLPLNREALSVLASWRKQLPANTASPYVFPGTGNRPLTTITKSWRGVSKAAGLRDFHFHDLRHHFASRLVQSGVDLNTVRELLGHADLQMVLRYAHLAPGGLASAVEKVTRLMDRNAGTSKLCAAGECEHHKDDQQENSRRDAA